MSTIHEINEGWQEFALQPAWHQLHRAQIEYDELRAELQVARQEVMEQAKLNGRGAEREARLMAEVAELKTALERIKALPPVAWLVLSTNQDGSISVEYVAEWPEAAHEHINDAISEYDNKEAASWVVRPVIYALGSKT